MKISVLVFLSFGLGVSWGQLTQPQKVEDFQNLAALFAKQYGPTQWVEQLSGYNLDKIGPWLAQVQQTTDDLGFYELMAEYVASLNDAHSLYHVPSDFVANLGFTCDIYEGKVLIDSIDPTILSPTQFDFQIGDELVMVDGRPRTTTLKTSPDFALMRTRSPPAAMRWVLSRFASRSLTHGPKPWARPRPLSFAGRQAICRPTRFPG